MVKEQDDEMVVRTVREKIDAGYAIAVVGWISSNHDDFTRNLGEEKVIFFESAPNVMPKRVGYVILTRFVNHGDTHRVKKQVHTNPRFFPVGRIKAILKEVALNGHVPQKPSRVLVPTPILETKPMERPTPAPTASISQNGAEPHVEISEKEREAAFAQDFSRAVNGDPMGTLTRYELSPILRRHFGEKANASGFKQILEPVRKEGQKAGSYRATAHLLDLMTSNDVEPTDPVEKARWLMKRRPALEERHEQLVSEKRSIEKELERIDKAAELLESLKKL